MDGALSVDWQEIIDSLARDRRIVAWLLHGSRAPSWPEPPVAQSDYDLVGIQEAGLRERSRRRLGQNGPCLDLELVSMRGFRGGQLMAPETHVMLRYGTRLGDWSWCELSVRLSWVGADDALEDAKTLLDAASTNWPDNAGSACRLALEAVRKCLTLDLAIGALEQPPTWASAVARYGLDASLIHHARTHTLEGCRPGQIAAWASDALRAARAAVANSTEALTFYGRNSSDAEVTALVQ
jgi:hypothetical protein